MITKKKSKTRKYNYTIGYLSDNASSNTSRTYRCMNGLKKRYSDVRFRADIGNDGEWNEINFTATPMQYKNIIATVRRRYDAPNVINRENGGSR